MWSILLSSLMLLAADVLLPAILKWLGLLESTLAGSDAAKKLLKKSTPKTYDEFKAIFPQLVEESLNDATLKKAERAKVLLAAALVQRPLFLKALWNRICLDPKASSDWIATSDIGYVELLQEMRAAKL